MRSIAKTIILAAKVAALAALLLAGCQRSDQKEPAKTPIQSGKELAYSLKKDSVEAFCKWQIKNQQFFVINFHQFFVISFHQFWIVLRKSAVEAEAA